MEYKITLTPNDAGTFILKASQPINGTILLALGEELLKKNLENVSSLKYNILGNVTNYTLSVPSATAVASGKFVNTDRIFVSCPEDHLRKYIHHLAHVSKPNLFEDPKTVVTEEIDDLSIIRDWTAADYPTSLV